MTEGLGPGESTLDYLERAGHGWVRPRRDGQKSRCGGPAVCSTCCRELGLLREAAQRQSEAYEAVRQSNENLVELMDVCQEWHRTTVTTLPDRRPCACGHREGTTTKACLALRSLMERLTDV